MNQDSALSRSFYAVWIAQTLSLAGNAVAIFALPTAAIIELGATPFEAGLLLAAPHIPVLLFGIVMGAWVDQHGRRRDVMILAELSRALVLATVPVAALFGVVSLPLLFVVATLNGAAIFVSLIAYQAYLRQVVAQERLVDANAKIQLSQGLVIVVGPALAGGLIAIMGSEMTLLVACGAMLASGASLALFARADGFPPLGISPVPATLGARVNEGIRAVWGSRVLRPVMLQAGMLTFAVYATYAVVLVFAYGDLGLSPAEFGLAQGVGSVGWITSALLISRASSRLGLARTLTASCGLVGLGLLTLSTAGATAPLVAIAAGQLLLSAGWPAYNVGEASLRQIVVPDAMLGRASAAVRWLRSAAIVAAGPIAGASAMWFGSSTVILGAGLVAIAAAGWSLSTAVVRVRTLRPRDS